MWLSGRDGGNLIHFRGLLLSQILVAQLPAMDRPQVDTAHQLKRGIVGQHRLGNGLPAVVGEPSAIERRPLPLVDQAALMDQLHVDCPNMNLNATFMPFCSETIGEYVLTYLPKTFEIIKSSSAIDLNIIGKFVQGGIKDHRLPFTQELLVRNLACTDVEIQDYLKAQSPCYMVTFAPMEFKILQPYQYAPFSADPATPARYGRHGTVEKVLQGTRAFAKKTLKTNSDKVSEIIRMELKILQLATESKNPHLIQLQCGYQHFDQICFVTYPWCDTDLHQFLKSASDMDFWAKLHSKGKLILVCNWMACLASGLAALHGRQVKHQDIKPKNILLYPSTQGMVPVICDFGLSKNFVLESKSEKRVGTISYFSPEQYTGKVGRKGDVFSIGLVFSELAMYFFGCSPMVAQFPSGLYAEITDKLDAFLGDNFPLSGDPNLVRWCESFHSLLRGMLKVDPKKRSTASTVWQHMEQVVISLGGHPHCEVVSPVNSVFSEEEEAEDKEIVLRTNYSTMIAW